MKINSGWVEIVQVNLTFSNWVELHGLIRYVNISLNNTKNTNYVKIKKN